MRQKGLIPAIIVVFLLIGGMGRVESLSYENSAEVIPLFENNQILEIAVVFINFDHEILTFGEINLPNMLWGIEILNYIVDYSFYEANDSYKTNVMNFIDSIAKPNAVTSKLKLDELNAQAIDGHVRDIFEIQNGTAIPAEEIEEWFHSNPYEQSSDYCYYVLNLTKFDTTDHSEEHWFSVKELDVDTGVQRHWWRNEWDFPLNFDVSFPFVGYGHKYRNYFFDPTAYQWYTQWYYTWNNISTETRYYSETDLDEFLHSNGNFTDYIEQWLTDVILYQHYVPYPEYGKGISVELAVFHNVSHLGLSSDDLKWVVNETEVVEALSQLAPNSEITFTVDFKSWNDYPEIQSFFSMSELDPQESYSGDPPIPDYRYYDAYTLYTEYLWDPDFTGKVFDKELQSEINVTGYAFIIDNATFASPGIWSGGGLYTGLGGSGQIVQLLELDRLFYPNRTKTRQGFTNVVIHETGHAIGYYHTFGGEICISDFIGDVMGYYPGTSRYSKVRIEAFQRQAVNIRAVNETNNFINEVNDQFSLLSQEEIERITEFQEQFLASRKNHSYAIAWDVLAELEFYLQNLSYETLPQENPSIDPLVVTIGVIGVVVLLGGGVLVIRRLK